MWPIVLSSAVFFGFICWDMAGDENGWRAALWAPFAVMSVPILLKVFTFLYAHIMRDTSGGGGGDGNRQAAYLDGGGGQSATAAINNPLRTSNDVEMRSPSVNF
jgi:hypothetical protein